MNLTKEKITTGDGRRPMQKTIKEGEGIINDNKINKGIGEKKDGWIERKWKTRKNSTRRDISKRKKNIKRTKS